MIYANYVRNKMRHLYKTAEAEGVPCILKYSKGKYMKDYEIYGNSVQDGTPSPENPVEIQSVGDLTKNLIPYPYFSTTKTTNGVTFTDNGDGSITVNGTATANAVFYLVDKQDNYTLDKCGLKIGDSYTISKTSISGDDLANIYFTANYYDENGKMQEGAVISNSNTATKTIKPDFKSWGIYLLVLKDKTINNTTIKIQLEKGSSATEYEPYHKYDIPIMVAGKNLIPYPYMYTTKTENGVTWTDNGDGSVTVSGTATGYSDFIFKIMSIAPNKTFTFSKNQSDDAANIAFILKQLDENRVPVGTEINLIPTVMTHTFNTVENARYIQIACKRYGNAECKGTYKPMLELGDAATEYEPYHEPITTHIYLDEPLRKVGGYFDYVDFKKQKVVRNIKEITLNGSENWRLQGTNENGIIGFIYTVSMESASSTTNIPALSTHLTYRYGSFSNITEQGFLVQHGAGVTNIYIRMLNEEISNITAFKTWLSENNVTVYYQMLAPTEESISLPTLQTFKDTTIMSVDTTVLPSNIKVTYVRT